MLPRGNEAVVGHSNSVSTYRDRGAIERSVIAGGEDLDKVRRRGPYHDTGVTNRPVIGIVDDASQRTESEALGADANA